MTEQLEALGSIATSIEQRMTLAQEELTGVGAVAHSLLEGAEIQGKRPARADLAAIRDRLQDCLRRPEPVVDGVGVAMAVDYLQDSPYWLEWWRRTGGEGLEFVAHSLNPHRDAFYDYSSRGWFTAPADSGETTVTGPYVDVGGTNAYTVTLSLPLFTDRGFAGVAGADIAAARFERFLLGPERQLRLVVLVNAAWRVIASNSADFLPGDLLDAGRASSWTHVRVATGTAGRDSWRLLHPGRRAAA